MKTTAQYYIDKLELEPHPEEGYYRQLYGNDASGKKDVSTIYYMLTANDISAFHRLHGVVEIWYYHAGEPLNLYVIDTTELIRTSQSWDGAELTCNNLNGFHVDNLSIMSR